MQGIYFLSYLLSILLTCTVTTYASNICNRYPSGSTFQTAGPQLSKLGSDIINVTLTFMERIIPAQAPSFAFPNGTKTLDFYCYMMDNMIDQAPVFRIHPGERFVINLKNALVPPDNTIIHDFQDPIPCGSSILTNYSTNIHFHGTHIDSICHRDEVVKTLINPGEVFVYDLVLPTTQPPGLAWYHPHAMGSSEKQAGGGATSVIIVEGIENIQPAVAGLPEQVFIWRDQADESALEDGTEPASDITLNFIPINYPTYPTVQMPIKPGERQFWRMANTGVITLLNLTLLYDGVPQVLELVSLDGVPMGTHQSPALYNVTSLFLATANRAEFIVTGPSLSVSSAVLVTNAVYTGPVGDADPYRPLVTLVADNSAPTPSVIIPQPTQVINRIPYDLLNAVPTVFRTIRLWEQPVNRSDPNSDTEFYAQPIGEVFETYEQQMRKPNIIAMANTTEEWLIENTSGERHVFHIHQMQFILLEINGVPVPDPQYYDSINIDYWEGGTDEDPFPEVGYEASSPDTSKPFPSVKIRLSFNNIQPGMFVYHCHILEHEDKGMMSVLQVIPYSAPTDSSSTSSDGKLEGGLLAAAIILPIFGGLCLLAGGFVLYQTYFKTSDPPAPRESVLGADDNMLANV